MGSAARAGRCPGEAYADSRQAARVGRFNRTVDEMQTPYVFPQENGNRIEVCWAELRGPGGGLRVNGAGVQKGRLWPDE